MIQERSTTLASVQSEIQSLQKEGSLDANEQVAKFHARAGELQKQLQRINDEQKARICRTKRALQVAKEELMKAKLEASYIAKELTGVQEAWLPAWLAVHCVHCQSGLVLICCAWRWYFKAWSWTVGAVQV